ncbi:Caveolin [Ancylostoma caninum]|uniref:Caveolin n=1 Tax=Ancylostoma caninum TaxID=29170 RepID=A0A368GSN1_ANCCA|nr:Caveolin [Ancylostoma caninum]
MASSHSLNGLWLALTLRRSSIMSRKSSARSLSQGRSKGDDCEHGDEDERQVEAPQGHVQPPRAPDTSNVKVERSADALPAPEEVKYILPAESSRPNPKTSLPMPEPPARKKNPQTAFDFNCKSSKEVIAHQLNMEDRDQNHLNQDLKTQFLDIFGEPDPQYHSVACVWTNSYRVFEITRIYCYKILTLILGLPVAFLAGFVFALFSFLRIWIVQV